MQARVLLRVAAVLLLTAFALVENGTDILLPWHPLPTYGFSSSPSGTVTAVDATAAKAGLRVDDVIDIAPLTPLQRLTMGTVTIARQSGVFALPLRTGRTILIPSHVYPRTLSDNVTDVIVVLAMAAYIILAAVLVLLRPSPTTWAFYVFSLLQWRHDVRRVPPILGVDAHLYCALRLVPRICRSVLIVHASLSERKAARHGGHG